MLALRQRQLLKHGREILLALPMHLGRKFRVTRRRFFLHRMCKREQFIQGRESSCRLGLQQQCSQQRHENYPAMADAQLS
jgi:hypothetical protein